MGLKDKTDAELAADTYMVAAELSSLCMELTRRGITVETLHYSSGKVEIDIKRITEEKL